MNKNLGYRGHTDRLDWFLEIKNIHRRDNYIVNSFDFDSNISYFRVLN